MSTKKLKTWLVFISLTLLVLLRFITTRPVYKNGDKIRISGNIMSDPVKYETSQYIKFTGLIIYLPLTPEISYGDKIVVEGTVGKDKLQKPQLISVEDPKNYSAKFRGQVIAFYQRTLPEPYAGLVAGVTLGSKGGLTKEFWEKVKRTGVAHVVVASGMNVTFVTSFLINFLAIFLPRKKMIPFVILGIILYLSISGFDAPLVRAAIMGGLTFFAQETGRLVSSFRVLALSALVMLVIKPEWVADIGFLLSFTATASLMLFESKVRKRLSKVPNLLREGLSTSLAAQIGVTPILFVTFGQFNILSPIINALVLWTVPLIMILGALGGVVGLIMPIFGKLILYLCYPLLWWFNSIVTLLDF